MTYYLRGEKTTDRDWRYRDGGMRERLVNLERSQRSRGSHDCRDGPDDRLLLRVEDAARRLSLSRAKVWSLVSSGSLPSIHVGRSRRIVAADLEAWVAARTAEENLPS